MQLITEAKKICPEVIIVLGEDLTRFRHASKELYNWLRAVTWSDRAERLGFDEVWYVEACSWSTVALSLHPV
jgi:DNA polymerase iota